MHMHQYMYTCPPDFACLLHPPIRDGETSLIRGGSTDQRWDLLLELPPPIGSPTCDWRSHLWLELLPLIGGPTSNQRSHLQLKLPSLIGCGHTPWLECVHASVHEFMSTWLPMSAPPPMHSLMKTWVPLCGIVCLSQSPYFWTHTSVRICTCISTWIYVHLTPHVCSTPYAQFDGNMGTSVWLCVFDTITLLLDTYLS